MKRGQDMRSSPPAHDPSTEREVSLKEVWFGVLGGAIAWSVHFLVLYFLVEALCVTGTAGTRVFGFALPAFVIAIVTVVALLVAFGAAVVAHRSWRRWRGSEHDEVRLRGSGAHLLFLGLLLNGFFVLMILVETLPIFFLGPCG